MTQDEKLWLQKVGAKLRELRIKNGYSSAESFSNELELARGYYWKIENGKNNLTVLYLRRLCEAHGLSLEEFLSEMNSESSSLEDKS